MGFYYEIIELKRSNATLLKLDRNKWVVTSQVCDAVNQAAHYISKIEQNFTQIHCDHEIDLYRLKAKVLIGYLPPDNPDLKQKRAALRRFKSHLHRIEIITFDELVRISQNVIDSNARESGQELLNSQADEVVFQVANGDQYPVYAKDRFKNEQIE